MRVGVVRGGEVFVEDAADPQAPSSCQVLINVEAVSLQWRDLAVMRATRALEGLGYIPCSDMCGVVAEVGAGVSRVRVGQRVVAMFCPAWLHGEEISPATYRDGVPGQPKYQGVLTEKVLVDAEALVRVPDHLTPEQASCVPCASVTAWRALMTQGHLQAGQVVVVQGTGGVATAALQLAVAAGARVIVTSSQDSKLERARAMGAWATINYTTHPQWGRIARDLAADTEGVHQVVDVGGAITFCESMAAIRAGGLISLVGILSGTSTKVNLFKLIQTRARVHGIVVGNRDDLEQVMQFYKEHHMSPVLDAVYPLSDSPAAFKSLADAQHFGKVVISLGQSSCCVSHSEARRQSAVNDSNVQNNSRL
mmetsp:Transcript_10135/g.19184  ORF Transcript_10135/g.19184 Transcript_10135/m.19184 type:complete len:366 (-) Transcript_10135:423-1520(-)